MTKLTRIKFIKFLTVTVWKVSKYGVFSGLYYPAFGVNMQYLSVLIPNAGKYRPEKPPYLNTFHAMCDTPLLMFHFHQCSTFLRVFYESISSSLFILTTYCNNIWNFAPPLPFPPLSHLVLYIQQWKTTQLTELKVSITK